MFKKKKEVDPIMNFKTKKEEARKRRQKQIFAFFMIGLTVVGGIITALTVLTSEVSKPTAEQAVSTTQSSTPETIKSLLDDTYKTKSKSLEEQASEKKQEDEQAKQETALHEAK